MNIYSESDENREFSIESIAQNCLNVELNYIPYHLTHTELIVWKDDNVVTKEVSFFLFCFQIWGLYTKFSDGFYFNGQRQSNTCLSRKRHQSHLQGNRSKGIFPRIRWTAQHCNLD